MADPNTPNPEPAGLSEATAAIAEAMARLGGQAREAYTQAAADLAPLVVVYAAAAQDASDPERVATAERMLAHLRAQAALRAAWLGIAATSEMESVLLGIAIAAGKFI